MCVCVYFGWECADQYSPLHSVALCILCTRNISLDKNFAKPSYLCIAEKFRGKVLIKVTISSIQSLVQDKKFVIFTIESEWRN